MNDQTNDQANDQTNDKVKRWYFIHVYSGQEKYVAQVLEKRIELKSMQESFEEIVVPVEEVVEIKGGVKRRSERKFFPGYVLVKMVMNDELWHFVKAIPKVMGFVGGKSEKPTPISDEEADKILNRVQEGVEKPRPKVLFEPGEVVRVIEGPFADYDGEVEDINYDKNRLRVAVHILGRKTPVELEFDQVEKI